MHRRVAQRPNRDGLGRLDIGATVPVIPIAMPAVLSATMAVEALAVAKRKAIGPQLDAVEETAGIDVPCTDEAGTPTQNRLKLRYAVVLDGEARDMVPAGAPARGGQHDAGPDGAVARRRAKRRGALMPIRPQYRWLYPIDWRELSASVRFRRARGRCEGCGRPHGRVVVHLGDGWWWDDERQTWRCGKGRTVRRRPQPADHGPPGRTTWVVLATAHLNHDPFNNVPENLATFCQRCHILHDKAEHLRRRRLTYLARRALGDLFTGPNLS